MREPPASVEHEDVLGRDLALRLWRENQFRSTRHKRPLTPYEWDQRGPLLLAYRDSTDAAERDDAARQLRAIDGEPEGATGLGLPDGFMESVRVACELE